MGQQLHISANIRAEAARRGKTQADLAHAIGTSRQAISQRLLGRINWRIDELQTIADFLGVPLAELINTGTKASA